MADEEVVLVGDNDIPENFRAPSFTGENAADWISAMEFEFLFLKVPKEELHFTRYMRAFMRLEDEALQRWFEESHDYDQSWEGIKQFVTDCYGEKEADIVRERLRRLRWRGTVQQLDEDLREALDGCAWIHEEELIETFVSLLPEDMKTYWLTKSTPDDGYKHAVKICLDYQNSQGMWMHFRGVPCSTARTSTTDREPKTQQGQQRETTNNSNNKTYSKNPSKLVPLHRLGRCRHCKGEGHYSQACANLRGTKASEDTVCHTCTGKGHFPEECASNLEDGGREIAETTEAERFRRKA
ncbi:hypothetical protein Emed_000769 [Eimeria media]